MNTLSDILTSANAYLDLESTLPTGTELTTRIDFANQALRDGAAAYRFKEFSETFFPSTSTLTSYSMPTNFRELEGTPAIVDTNGDLIGYPQIKPEERYSKDSDANYCYQTGSVGNYSLTFNNFTANATISIPYQRFPSGMATLTDVCELPDAEYVKLKLISYVLQSRSDERFPTIEAEANNRLLNMIGRSMLTPTGGTYKLPTNQTYRIGK